MDNVSALTYVNWMGGTHSPDLMRIACILWDWYLQQGITLSASAQLSGALLGRSICQSPEPSNPQIHQLETRPWGYKHGCFSGELEEPRGICLFFICADRQMSTEDKNGAEHSRTDSPCLAEPALVPQSAGNDSGTSLPPTLVQRHGDRLSFLLGPGPPWPYSLTHCSLSYCASIVKLGSCGTITFPFHVLS